MSTPDLIAFLLRQAEIASSTDRGGLYGEAAARLGSTAEDKARLDFVEANRLKLFHEDGWWYVTGPSMPYGFNDATAREAIDAAAEGTAADAV